ncbi:hypothetical protein Hanom_Chr04g00366971 [Helianthus anomalus]
MTKKSKSKAPIPRPDIHSFPCTQTVTQSTSYLRLPLHQPLHSYRLHPVSLSSYKYPPSSSSFPKHSTNPIAAGTGVATSPSSHPSILSSLF